MLHDNLIAAMTEHTYDCYESYERKLGNEFDWIWDEPTSTLQLIWRPEDDLDKVLTVFVPKQVGFSTSFRVSLLQNWIF